MGAELQLAPREAFVDLCASNFRYGSEAGIDEAPLQTCSGRSRPLKTASPSAAIRLTGCVINARHP